MNKLLSVTITLGLSVGSASSWAAFVGPYDFSNWTFAPQLNSSNAHVELANDAESVHVFGSDSGSGRASVGTFTVSPTATFVPTEYHLTITKIGDPLTVNNNNPVPLFSVTYTGTFRSLNVSYDWQYHTDDVDGSLFDPCHGCNGIGQLTQPGDASGESSHVVGGVTFDPELLFSNASSIGSQFPQFFLKAPIGAQISADVSYAALHYPSLILGVSSADSNLGGADALYSNFNAVLSETAFSGTVTALSTPIPSTTWLLLSPVGVIFFSKRRARELG